MAKRHKQKNSKNDPEQKKHSLLSQIDPKLQFLANVSHEFRTPLTSIIGFSELLGNTYLTEKQKKHLHAIDVSAKSLRNLIDDLLDFSKIQAGMMKIENTNFNLEQIISDVVNICKLKGAIKNLNFIYYVDDSIHQTICGDPHRLQQILVNLVGNAVKFTNNGEIFVSALMDSETESEYQVYLSVKDTGIGISNENQKNIFDAFNQAMTSISRQFGGTGLGLPISNNLVKLMGGKGISVNSEVGIGSTFSFILPFAKVPISTDVSDDNLTDTPDRENLYTTVKTKKFDSYKILVVDDTPLILELVRAVLSDMGHSVVTVENGQDAIDTLKNDNFDMVLMDIQMPNMDGLETTRLIRKLGFYLPIIALTASVGEESKEQCLLSGMNDFLIKPIDVPQLMQVIQRTQRNNHHFNYIIDQENQLEKKDP